jgi:adenylosuccinate lyase
MPDSRTEMIPNVLAARYASPALRAIWSPTGKIRLEREYWIAVMAAQQALGLPIPQSAIDAYRAAIDTIDLAAIDARERVTRHDVKARIEALNALAGHEHIHKGMTSRDLTENVEQLQVYRSLICIRDKSAALLAAIARRAAEWRDVVITARSHNVAAQPTTMGKRLANYGEELLLAFDALEGLVASYPARGLKGAVGTQLDQLTLFGGDAARVAQLEATILEHLGLPAAFDNVGQVYPRSLDFAVVSNLCQLASGPANLARTLRLMAGHDLASEGFAPGQVGSSAMPHKMNARSCERIHGFHTLLKGYLTMVGGLIGDQWNEGDVSCSVVRRVVLPDAFFAIDGLLETSLVVVAQMEVFPAVISRENSRTLPFLATTTLLMEAVKAGAGRELAHAAIKEHALAAVRALRDGASDNDLAARLAADSRLGLSRQHIDAIFADGAALCGRAGPQVDSFVARCAGIAARHPQAAAYQPHAIL